VADEPSISALDVIEKITMGILRQWRWKNEGRT
jgi:hypothetical protein